MFTVIGPPVILCFGFDLFQLERFHDMHGLLASLGPCLGSEKMSINMSDNSRCFRTTGSPMSYGFRSIRDKNSGSLTSIWRC